jgi:alpha-galactosidase
MKPALILFTALLLAPLAVVHAATPSQAEIFAATQWAQSNVFAESAKLPFSFTFAGRTSDELLRDLQRTDAAREINALRRQRTRTWTDKTSGLQLRCVATEYAEFPVVEWTVWLKNTGKADTAIIENIQGLDVTFQREATGEFVLHGIRGDSCIAESFRPYVLTLGPDAVKRCSPPVAGDKVSGKSSDGPDGWPYWNLQRPGGCVILAVGWPGQWEATFTRDHARGLRVTAGQQLTRLVLKPGEEIRTPSITLLFWQGDDVVRAQNLWRSWYLAHVLPRIDGQPQPPRFLL